MIRDNVISPSRDSQKSVGRRNYQPILKWLIIILVVLIIFYLGTLPVRGKLSDHYVQSGDELLLQRKYISADLEYQKALLLKGSNTTAKARRTLADQAALDILKLEPLLKEENSTDLLSVINDATAVPKDETAAVQNAKKLIEAGEYQLAITAAETGVQMDKTYRDGWLYLGIANLKSAELLEISPAAKDYYQEKAKEALEEAKTLDPTYEPTLNFLQAFNR